MCFDKTGLEIVSTCADYRKYNSVLKGNSCYFLRMRIFAMKMDYNYANYIVITSNFTTVNSQLWLFLTPYILFLLQITKCILSILMETHNTGSTKLN